MTESEGKTPDAILDGVDPGDDVASRFRYQYSYAAVNATRIVSESDSIECIVCENHEDFLVRLKTGKFIAVQIKTRNLNLSRLKTTDDPILKSLSKFCALDAKFPDQFDSFDLSTNHSFWDDKEDHNNLVWLLKQLNEKPTVKSLKKTNPKRIAVERIAEQAELTLDQAVATLCKVKLNARNEPVSAMTSVVIAALNQCKETEGFTYPALLKAANLLIDAAAIASSKEMAGNVSELYAAGSDFAATAEKMILAGKFLAKDQVLAVIKQCSDSLDEPIFIEGLIPPADVPKDLGRMFQKLVGGKLQNARIELVEDLVRSFQYLEVGWARKYGLEKAKEMRSDIMGKTLADCAEAEALIGDTSVPYGPEKYDNLKKALKQRRDEDPSSLRGCTIEHLIGAAGILTEQCKVWWSPKFDLKGVSDE